MAAHLLVAGNPSKKKHSKKHGKKGYWKPFGNPSKTYRRVDSFGGRGSMFLRVGAPILGGMIGGLMIPRMIPNATTPLIRYGAPIAGGVAIATLARPFLGKMPALIGGAAMLAAAGLMAFDEFVLRRSGKPPLLQDGEQPIGSGMITMINDAPATGAETTIIEEERPLGEERPLNDEDDTEFSDEERY